MCDHNTIEMQNGVVIADRRGDGKSVLLDQWDSDDGSIESTTLTADAPEALANGEASIEFNE